MLWADGTNASTRYSARLASDACPVPLSAPFGRGPEHHRGNRSWRAWTGL